MKINKLMSLDIELIEKLKKEGNASGLVNRLLKAHFEGGKMSKEALEAAIEAKKEELASGKKFLENLEEQLLKINKPKSLMDRIRV